MKDVLHKRGRRFFTKSAKVGGALAADSLGSLQDKKPRHQWYDKNGVHHLLRKCRGHQWLFGTDNAVCSNCGLTVPKDTIHLYKSA